jgi:uncharacterized protein (TIGR00251 family)
VTALPARREGADIILMIRVQPRASRDELILDGERLRLRITAPPVDGAANSYLVRYLADCFDTANSRVEIVRGMTGREKTVRIYSPTTIPDAVLLAIEAGEDQKHRKK